MDEWVDQYRRFRAGPANLPFRLVADDGYVFATLDFTGPVHVIDAITGETIHTIEGSEKTKQILYEKGILTLLVDEDVDRLDAIDEAFAFAEKTGERYLEAELHRLRGELLLLESRVEAAADAFERALAVARRQGARSLELRAATSQARLLKRDGRKAETRELLSSVYSAFTEGFETPDLQDAKALLDSL